MRRRARQCALQILYQMDVSRVLQPGGEGSLEGAIAEFWASFEQAADEERSFAERLVRGIASHLAELDHEIAAVSHRWKMDRMDKVVRNLLRVAAYEILWCPDIPAAASINEALEIAKRFSDADSVAFVNGVLDRLAAGQSEHLGSKGEA